MIITSMKDEVCFDIEHEHAKLVGEQVCFQETDGVDGLSNGDTATARTTADRYDLGSKVVSVKSITVGAGLTTVSKYFFPHAPKTKTEQRHRAVATRALVNTHLAGGRGDSKSAEQQGKIAFENAKLGGGSMGAEVDQGISSSYARQIETSLSTSNPKLFVSAYGQLLKHNTYADGSKTIQWKNGLGAEMKTYGEKLFNKTKQEAENLFAIRDKMQATIMLKDAMAVANAMGKPSLYSSWVRKKDSLDPFMRHLYQVAQSEISPSKPSAGN